ncbi:MAG TPA: ribonuclease, partial [Sphingomicrobium sp.]|nr:ribonuclease [Sphingomicrobium sp.]
MTADPKGHRARSPWQMPLLAWKQIASRTWQRTWDDNVGLVAAGVAFYSFFALLSLLAMIVLVYGLAADPSLVIDTMQTLTAILPHDV